MLRTIFILYLHSRQIQTTFYRSNFQISRHVQFWYFIFNKVEYWQYNISFIFRKSIFNKVEYWQYNISFIFRKSRQGQVSFFNYNQVNYRSGYIDLIFECRKMCGFKYLITITSNTCSNININFRILRQDQILLIC